MIQFSSIMSLMTLILVPLLGHGQNALIIGHRGSSYTMPENTVLSATTAWEEGADAVEIDVYATADDQIVVIHDKSTKRTTGQDHEVSSTNSDILTALDAGKWKGPEFEGVMLPYLTDIIEVIPRYKQLVIEIKSGPEIIPLLRDLLMDHPRKSQIIFIAFGWEVIRGIHEVFPEVPCFWLSSRKNDVIARWDDVLKAGLDGINLHYKIIDEAIVQQAHQDGMGILAWTVNDIKEVHRLIKIGIDGITTDRPGFIRAQLLKEMEFDR